MYKKISSNLVWKLNKENEEKHVHKSMIYMLYMPYTVVI